MYMCIIQHHPYLPYIIQFLSLTSSSTESLSWLKGTVSSSTEDFTPAQPLACTSDIHVPSQCHKDKDILISNHNLHQLAMCTCTHVYTCICTHVFLRYTMLWSTCTCTCTCTHKYMLNIFMVLVVEYKLYKYIYNLLYRNRNVPHQYH